MTTTQTATDLHLLGVRETAEAIAQGTLSPVDVTEALLDRIADLDGQVHAWAHLDPDGARAEAETLAAEARSGRLRGPLHGVAFGLKDVFHVRGMPTKADAALKDGPPRTEDSTVAARLRAAGAIVFGKLHTLQYAHPGSPFSRRDAPPTRNPWNLEHTAGGSSSGSGASVGARFVPFSIGEQTGGSNLRPAAYCGVSGLIPTYGRISRYGLIPLAWSFDRAGIIARSVEDLALVFSIAAGQDPRDPTTLPDRVPPATIDTSRVERPRIGIVREFFLERSEQVMRDATEAAAARLEAAGASVREVRLPVDFKLISPLHTIINGVERTTYDAAIQWERGTAAEDAVTDLAGLIPSTYYLHAQRVRRWMHGELLKLFEGVDALMMPTTPGPAPRGIESTGSALFLSPWSTFGFPAISIGAGLSPDGLPMGLQFVASPLGEEKLLQLGAWCENLLGRLPAPPLR